MIEFKIVRGPPLAHPNRGPKTKSLEQRLQNDCDMQQLYPLAVSGLQSGIFKDEKDAANNLVMKHINDKRFFASKRKKLIRLLQRFLDRGN
jgi:hypothetical protein